MPKRRKPVRPTDRSEPRFKPNTSFPPPATGSCEAELAVRAGRIDVLVQNVQAAASPSQRRWASEELASGLDLADPGSLSSADVDSIRTLLSGVIAANDLDRLLAASSLETLPPHAVRVPLVAEPHHQGFVRVLYVNFRPGPADGLGANLDIDAQRAFEHALTLAAERAGRRGIGEHQLVAAQPAALVGVNIDGASLGAAVFASAYSLWTYQPVREGTAITGALVGDHITSVGGLAAKLAGCIRGRSDVKRLIVPVADLEAVRAAAELAQTNVELIGVATLDELIAAAIDAGNVRRPDLDEELAKARYRVRGAWAGWRWPSVREELERLTGDIPAARADQRVEALTLLSALHRHQGNPQRSLDFLRLASRIARERTDRVPDEPLAGLAYQLSQTYVHLCDFDRARAAVQEAIRVAQRGRLRDRLLRAYGCAGLVALSAGDATSAVHFQGLALKLARDHDPAETPRSSAYLIEALARAGRFADAEAAYEVASRDIRKYVATHARQNDDAWLRTAYATALAREARWNDVLQSLDAQSVIDAIADHPLPGARARRWRGLGLAATRRSARDIEAGYELLAESPVVYGTVTEPHLRFRLHANVLFEASARIAHGAWSDDVASRVHIALGHLPQQGRAANVFGKPATALRAALDQPSARRSAGRASLEATASALAAVLEPCERLA